MAIRGLALLCQRIPREYPFFNRPIIRKMLLHEIRNPLRGHAAVPGALGIDEHGRTVAADAQAADLRAIAGFRSGSEIVLPHLLFERFPGREADLRRAAVRPR